MTQTHFFSLRQSHDEMQQIVLFDGELSGGLLCFYSLPTVAPGRWFCPRNQGAVVSALRTSQTRQCDLWDSSIFLSLASTTQLTARLRSLRIAARVA